MRQTLQRGRQVLGLRAFRRFWLGMMISRLGDAFTLVALSWVVLSIAGPAQLGLVLLCFGLPRIVSGPVAGRLLDGTRPRLLLAADNAAAAGARPALPPRRRGRPRHGVHDIESVIMEFSGRGPVGFDLDMTLINSRPAILASFAAVGRETGTAIDLDAVDRRLGIKLDDELAYWFPPDRIDETAGIYRRHYLQLAEPMTTVLPGAHEALAAVRAAGQRVIIITAKHPVSAQPSLRAAGLSADELFTLVHGPEKAGVLRRVAAVAYVGDTPPDMAAAVQAGVQAVGVATGSFTGADLAAAGAEVVFASLEAFPAWYRSV
jgi:phosphoglycolate phosphatase